MENRGTCGEQSNASYDTYSLSAHCPRTVFLSLKLTGALGRYGEYTRPQQIAVPPASGAAALKA